QQAWMDAPALARPLIKRSPRYSRPPPRPGHLLMSRSTTKPPTSLPPDIGSLLRPIRAEHIAAACGWVGRRPKLAAAEGGAPNKEAMTMTRQRPRPCVGDGSKPCRYRALDLVGSRCQRCRHEYNRALGTRQQRGYGQHWQILRELVLERDHFI